jgi:hypothetical protein
MAKVYVSSTLADLDAERRTVMEWLVAAGHQPVHSYRPDSETVRESCLEDIDRCDLYVLILGHRYGFQPEEDNPGKLSITHLEFRRAEHSGVPRVALLRTSVPDIKLSDLLDPERSNLVRLFQEEVKRGVRPGEFSDLKGLLAGLSTGIQNELEKLSRRTDERVTMARSRATDWDSYRRAVSNKHQWVRLQVIAGVSKERGPVRIPLTEVFEPQLAAAGLPSTDVPDEVRKYQEALYSRRSQASADEAEPTRPEPELIERETGAESDEVLLSSNPELILDLLAREPTQVILGGPGSGKTTILYYAMLRICQPGAALQALPVHLRHQPIPFLIELRKYVLRKVPDFVTYIVENSGTYYDAALERNDVVSALDQNGQALVFFDGLDEIFDPDERIRVIEQFDTFVRRYPNSRVVVTSRIAGYKKTRLSLDSFDHYTLLPLTLAQIRHFADSWYRYYTQEGTERTAQGLIQRITESPRLLDLAGNPLLLTMMAVIYKDRDLPNERWKLYQRCAETMLEDWELGKGIEVQDFKLSVLVRTAQKSEILQRVAMYMLEHSQQGVELNAIASRPLSEIVAGYIVERYDRPRGEAEAFTVDILNHIMEHTYLLAAIGEGVFGFVHRTFMEYFAACHCQAQFNARKSDFTWLTRKIFGAHWRESEWEEVLLLLIAMLHDQGTPIHEVIEYVRTKSKLAVPFHVAFAARCLGEAGDLQDPGQGQALLAELANAIFECTTTSNKTFTEPGLKGFATLAPLVTPPSIVQELIDRLNKLNSVPARMAAWQMGFALRSRKERLDFALAALNDKEGVVRRGAISALEREWPGRADIGVALAGVVRNDRQAKVRQAALAAMQRSWRSEPSILVAIECRADEETGHNSVIRLIEYLGTAWRGNARARDLVLKLAGSKPNARDNYDASGVGKTAARALAQGWGGDEQAFAFLKDQAIHAGGESVFEAIAQGWGGKAEALALLKDCSMSVVDDEARRPVYQAIAQGWPGNAEALAFLGDQSTIDRAPQCRTAALRAIAKGWGGNGEALSLLKNRAIGDADPAIGVAAIRVLADGWGGDKQVFSFLRDLARDDSRSEARAAACESIAKGWAGDLDAFDFLLYRAVRDPDAGTRAAIINDLPLVADWHAWNSPWSFSDFVGRINRALPDSHPPVRKAIIMLIDRLAFGTPLFFHMWDHGNQLGSVVNWLRETATNDPDEEIRIMAGQVLPAFNERYSHMPWWRPMPSEG